MTKECILNFINKNRITIALLTAITIIIFRRPDAILNAQFWAEDGVVWFAKAYNEGGLKSLLEPQNGYFQSISKLTAWFSLLFPLKFAPLIFNSIAIIIKALPVALLWSDRFSKVIPSNKIRLAISIAYLILPTSKEVHSNITNAHWHLALYAFMIIISVPAKSILTKFHDILFIIISGLSGPFSIILSPVIIIFWWIKRKKLPSSFYTLFSLTILSGIIQIFSVLSTSEATRSQAPLGASFELLIRLLSGKLFGVLFLGEGSVNNISGSFWMSLPIFIIGIGIIIFALIKSNLELKLLIFFSILMIVAALKSPMVNTSHPQWPLMTNSSTGARYFFIPLVTWSVTLIWFFTKIKDKRIRLFLLILATLGTMNIIINDFKMKPFKEKEFKKHIEIFSNLPAGTTYKIPSNPGKGWEIVLIKK